MTAIMAGIVALSLALAWLADRREKRQHAKDFASFVEDTRRSVR